MPTERAARTGRICLELIATMHGRFSGQPKDDLADPSGLATWLKAMHLDTASPPRDVDAAEFQALREAIFRLVSVIGGTSTGSVEDQVAVVNKYARGRMQVVQLRASGVGGRIRLTAEAEPPTSGQVLTVLARDAVDLLTGPDVERLHQCQAESCGSFYLDASRGGQRRWCSSASCGNRARVAAFRGRNRA